MDGSTNSAAASILARAFIISFLFPELTASRSHENGFLTQSVETLIPCPTARTELIGWRTGYDATEPSSMVNRNIFAAIADSSFDDCSFRKEQSRAFICLRRPAMSVRSCEISSFFVRVFFVFFSGMMPSFSNLLRAIAIAREIALGLLNFPPSFTAIFRSVVVAPCFVSDTFTFLSQKVIV